MGLVVFISVTGLIFFIIITVSKQGLEIEAHIADLLF